MKRHAISSTATMGSPTAAGGFLPAAGRLVQRQCACGGKGGGASGECEECRKKKLVQRRPLFAQEPAATHASAVPPSVHSVIASSGRPLAATERAYFEPRFGYDFSQVRIHDDAQAASSANDVSALAYTVGQHIAFATGHFEPGTHSGRELLAHELAHTVQQRDSAPGAPSAVDAASSLLEHDADRLAGLALRDPPNSAGRPLNALQSQVQRTAVSHCTAGRRNAPADPQQRLDAIETFASTWALLSAVQAGSDATWIRLNRSLNPGQPALPTNASFVAFQSRFGLAPAAGSGFRNRVTGARFNSQEEAVASELDTLSARLMRMADQMDGNIHYFCIGGTAVHMGCEGHCTGRAATACDGIRAVMLCPAFWDMSIQAQTTLLIHELGHMIWASVGHNRNFTHTSCYANYVADVFHAPTTTPACAP